MKEMFSETIRCRISVVVVFFLFLMGTTATAEPPMSLLPDEPNVVAFPPVQAKYVRFVIHGCESYQPCIDELEIYAPGSDENLALADKGAKPSADSLLEGYPAHRIEHLNDGRYGNQYSWIAAQSTGWAQIELPEAVEIDRVVFSRDRGGQHTDRMPTAFEVQVSTDGQQWQTVRRVINALAVRTEEKFILPNRPNLLDFFPQEARFVRMWIDGSSGAPVCIDELEIFGEEENVNLALADKGAKATASSLIPGFPIHQIEHLNDGQYGNDHSWIPEKMPAWAQIELPEPMVVRRVVFARDRKNDFRDRLPTDFRIEISLDGKEWTVVKKIVAAPPRSLEQLAPGEEPIDWAYRVVASLPESFQETGRAMAEKARTEDDVRRILDLYRLHAERDEMIKRLDLEFNPEALRRAVDDLAASYPDQYQKPADFEQQLEAALQQREEVRKRLQTGDPAAIGQTMAEAEKVLEFPRSILLANPLLDFDEILVLKRKSDFGVRSDVYWDWGQKYGMTVNWSCDFRPKNPPVAPWWEDSLVACATTDRGRPLRIIFRPEPTHMLQQPELNFDAQKLAFAMPGPEGAFEVFEMNMDGSGLRQITTDTAEDIDNGDPCYLPDGRIVFNSTRLFIGVPCEDGNSYVSSLCLTDADGKTTRLLTFDQESNWHPSMLNNGRVLYTRYEYANISHQFGRLLFSMNPDGTNQMEYYGSNSYWPNSIFYARAIPNHSTMVVGVVCGHHGPNKTGRLVLFDPARGRRETAGAVQTIPGYGKPVERIVEDELYGNVWPKFAHPWPLSDKYFLVAARLQPGQNEYAIYLVDVFDNVTEIRREKGYSLLEPIPIKPRPRPPILPDRVRLDTDQATVYMANVYEGRAFTGVPHGSVKQLRLFTYNYVYRHSGNSGFGHLATPGADGPWEPRHILGTVPVNEDGSALFQVPANTPISIQPLDEQGRALQVMRSWFTAMPGEVLSCVGCHEQQNTSPLAAYSLAATGRRPEKIEPWHGPPRGFDFELEVQPVLDKYCVGCHDGSKPGRPDLARKSAEEKLRINTEYHQKTESGIVTVFTPSFIALHPYIHRPHAEDNYGLQVAAEYFADTSPLIQMLQKGHHGVQLDAEAWDRLYTWIDLGAPDLGSWKYSEWGVTGNFYERRLEIMNRYAGRIDDVERLPDAPVEIPKFIAPPAETPAEPVECPGWPLDAAEAAARQQAVGLPVTMEIPIEGTDPITLVLIPPGEFVMGSADGGADERPLARVRIDRPFYMSSREVTNAQFAAVADPGHSSGLFGWRSIDWRGEGYPLDDPGKPAVRLSWQQAMQFCDILAERTGRTVSLPSEAQWEWAARAGTATPFWYGGPDDDFGTFENLAGREQRAFAFGAKRKWYLRDDRFDDGQMITAPVGSYQPNAWGLYDMVGNVAEWTLSDYRPYPYDPSDGREAAAPEGEKVVRGGSWYVPPRFSTASYRWKYPAWRRVFNVGFRVVVLVEP